MRVNKAALLPRNMSYKYDNNARPYYYCCGIVAIFVASCANREMKWERSRSEKICIKKIRRIFSSLNNFARWHPHAIASDNFLLHLFLLPFRRINASISVLLNVCASFQFDENITQSAKIIGIITILY